VSQADIDKLHRQLGELEGESGRQKKGAKQIQAAAVKKLAEIEKKLSELEPMTNTDEYKELLLEKGILQQVIGQTHL
jgi:hypothetical protein